VRKRFKIPLLTLVLLFVGAGVILLLLIKTDWLPRRASGLINEALEHTADLHIEIGDFGGNLLSGIAAENVVVTRADAPSDTVVVIARVSAEYDIRDLWERRWVIRSAVIDSPRVYLPQDSLRQFLASFARKDTTASRQTKPLVLFDFDLHNFVIQGGRAYRRSTSSIMVDSFNLQLSAASHGSVIAARLRGAEAVIDDYGRVSASGLLHSESGAWKVDSVEVSTSRSRIHASGSMREWVLRTDPLDLADAAFITRGIKGTLRFDGTINPDTSLTQWSIRGHTSGILAGYTLEDVTLQVAVRGKQITIDSVSGQVSGAFWNGSGAFDLGVKPERYSYGGSVRGFDLEQWAHGTFSTDLSGVVAVEGEGLNDETLALDLDVELGPSRFDDVRIDSAFGRLTVTTRDAVFDDDFQMYTNATELTGGGRIAYADSIDMFANVYFQDLRRWDSLVFVDSLAGRAYAYVYLSGLTEDPDLAGRLLSDSLRLFDMRSSSVEGWFYAPSFLSRPSGDVNFRFGASDAWGWAVDSVVLRASLLDRRVGIDSMAVFAPALTAQGRGWLDWSTDTVPVRLLPLTAVWEDQVFRATDTVAFAVNPLGFEFSQVEVESGLGEVTASGRVNYDESTNLDFSIEGVRISSMAHRLFPNLKADGLIAASGHLEGTLDNPILTLDGTIRELEYDGIPAGNLSGAIAYRENRLRTEELQLMHPNYRAVLAGEFPVSLDLSGEGAHVLEEPMSGRLSVSGEALELAAQLLPETVESVSGPFSIYATLGGTPRAPLVTGDAHLRNGTIKAIEIANPIENLQVDVLLSQDTIKIERAEGIIKQGGQTGKVSVTGDMKILSYNLFDYNLKVTGRDVPARFEFEDFYVETDFDLNVNGSDPPLVSGTIQPTRVEDRMPFEDEDTPEVIDPDGWDWDFTVEMPGNYWIHNEQIDAELSADLRILREEGRPTYLGQAEIIRGKVYLFDKIGRIQSGTLTFDNVNEPDPSLDIDVLFVIRQPKPDQARQSEGSQSLDVNLHVGGRASEPLIQPEPPYTEQDVLLLLTANTNFGGGEPTSASDPWADRLKFAATGLLFSEVQRVAARKLGLETLEISSEGDPTDAEITVGRYFSPHLYLYGSSQVDAGGGQEVGFEYRFNRHLFLEGNRDSENLYRLNLHFNWDY